MKRYITRYGQVLNYRDASISHLYHPGDILLSDLGQEQARLLGIRLRELGFHGRIISSPYRRTLHTSEIIASETGALITPYAPMREMILSEKHAENFKGLTIEEIKRSYNFIDPAATLQYPWWEEGIPAHVETHEEVRERIERGYAEINRMYPDTELLFVSHGAPVNALVSTLNIPGKKNIRALNLNCSLSMFDPCDANIETLLFDTAYMTYEITTSNHKSHESYDAEYFAKEYEGEIIMPRGICNVSGPKILCIGNTFSKWYPYYNKLIAIAKPDIILHTGNIVNEITVHSAPETKYEYIVKAKAMLNIMEASGAQAIIVPGNNDLFDEIERLAPKAKIYRDAAALGQDDFGHLIRQPLLSKTAADLFIYAPKDGTILPICLPQ